MNKILKILYIHSYSFWRKDSIMTIFYRISNYLNSKKDQLNGIIEEEYLDLEYEKLPEFTLKNLKNYRIEVTKLLNKIYERFNFNLVLISCYSSFSYINCIEVASMIKNSINHKCLIAVGGLHPTICPEDFQPGNFPHYFYQDHPKNFTPFDYLIKEEGEIPFYELVQSILNGNHKLRMNLSDRCIILKPKIIENLDEIPIIDLRLFEKYNEALKKIDTLWIDFSRGCIFSCKFCLNSENYLPCYKRVRIKSIKKCIDELNAINEISKNFPFKLVCISDLIFMPKRSYKKLFFRELNKTINKQGEFPFKIIIEDRVELCSLEDLENYKRLNIDLSIGIESFSKTLLYKMGKILGKDESQINIGIRNYLHKTVEIIKKANEIKLPIVLNYMYGVPGTDWTTSKEEQEFFFKKKYNGKSLIEKYIITLKLNKYMAYIGTNTYYTAEREFGTKFHFPKWWKIFDKDQIFFASLVDPSINLSFIESYNYAIKLIKDLMKIQSKLGNPSYSIEKLLNFKKDEGRSSYRLYKLVKQKYPKMFNSQIQIEDWFSN